MMAETNRISAATGLFCLLGDPVSHSKSPAMMNAAFGAANIDAVYLALRVSPDLLGAAVRGLLAAGIGGANVTAPHKEAVIPFLDDLSDSARRTGSVNTLVRDGDSLVGHSTDGAGLVGAVEEGLGREIRGQTVVVLGAGGAARGVLPAIIDRRPKLVVVCNRTEKKAASLVREFGGAVPLVAAGLPDAGLNDAIERADIVINAASPPVTFPTFLGVDLSRLREGSLLFDMNYGTPRSDVGTACARRSVTFSDGLPMLLFQGACSFALWTNRQPPLAVMRSALGLK
jgi:shikimate dehydrogenase